MNLAALIIALAAMPLAAATSQRLSCEAIATFAVDPPAASPSRRLRDFKIDRADLCNILTTYHEVSEAQWLHSYHHVAFADSTGTITLMDGMVLKWLVRPGGLATISYPNGSVSYLAKERQP